MPDGFRLGDFTFLAPGELAPIDRSDMRPRRPVLGAAPPDWLSGLVREAANDGPAGFLWNGDFCGHGEPAYSVFDIRIENHELLEICLIQDAQIGSLLTARPKNSERPWNILHHGEWFRSGTAKPTAPVSKRADEFMAQPGPGGNRAMRLAIGFEYPIECTSPNDISWVTVALMEEDASEIVCIVDEELF